MRVNSTVRTILTELVSLGGARLKIADSFSISPLAFKPTPGGEIPDKLNFH